MNNVTCIICPMGCLMEVTLDETGKKVVNVTGNTCKRGPEYAQKELLNPTRTLTTTVPVQNGVQKLVPVKTDGEIPKPLLIQSMEIVRRAVCKAPVKRGQVIVYDILGTGINIISCADVSRA